MQRLNETTRKNLIVTIFRLALALLAVLGLAAPTSMRAQAPGAVFTASNYQDAIYDFGGFTGRMTANQRGDVFFSANDFKGDPGILVMVPGGTGHEVTIITNLGAPCTNCNVSSSVTTDSKGNLWSMNSEYAVVFVPVTAGVYPNMLDQTKFGACTYPVASNTTPCSVSLFDSVLGSIAISDLQIDASGNMYVLDFADNQTTTADRIVKYATGGTAATAATVVVDNLPHAGANGAFALAPSGDVYVADGTNVDYSAAGSGIFSTITGFNDPSGASSDSGGNIYVTEHGNGNVTLLPNEAGTVNPADRYTIVNTATNNAEVGSVAIDGFGTITWEGGGYGGDFYRSPLNNLSLGPVALGSYANSLGLTLFFEKAVTLGNFKVVSNSGTSAPFSVTTTGGCTTGSVYAAAATCSVTVNYVATAIGPQAGTLLAYDNSGNLLTTAYLSGVGTGPILNVDPGTASALGSGWKDPSAVTVDAAGNTYVADSGTGDIYENGSSAPLITGFNNPSSIVVDPDGDLYVADSGNSRIVEIPFASGAYGSPITVFTGTSGPAGLAIDSSSNLYLADSGNGRVIYLGMAGNLPAGSNPSPIEGSFTTPVAVAADSTGNVYISDSGTGVISQYNFTRGTVTPIVNGLTTAAGLAVDPGGNLYYADAGKQVITRVPNIGGTPDPSSSTTLTTIVATPSSIAVDGFGSVYAADSKDATVGTLNRTNGTIDYGSVVKGFSSPVFPATISNGGNATLTLGTPYDTATGSNNADFAIQGSTTCADGAALTVGASCSIGFAFTPSTFASESETLSFTGTGTGAAGSLLLTGVGTGEIDVTITGPATVVYGNTASFAVTATQDGTYAVNITGSAVASASVVVSGGKGSFTTPVLHVGTYTLGLAGTIGTGSLSVTPATLTATIGNATRIFGTANPAFTSTIKGAVNGDSFIGGGTTTATLLSNVGTYPIVPTVLGSASGDYTVDATDGVLTVTQALSNTAIAYQSSNNSFLNGTVTFTATVIPLNTAGSPGGTVTFEDATNTDAVKVLGTGTVSSTGTATFSTTTLAAGTTYVEAVYSGDVNFIASHSIAQGVDILLPAFTLSTDVQTLQILQGQSKTVTVSVTPTDSFSSSVAFSCSGLPAEASCSFASPSVTPNGTTAATDVLTINTVGTSSSTAAVRHAAPWKAVGGSTVLALMIGTFAGLRRKRFTKGLFLFVFVGLLCLLPMTGCGLDEKNFATPLGIYQVTITGACAANNTALSTNVRVAVYTASN